MHDPELRRSAIALYDRFTHEHRDRRTFMAELTRLAGGAAAAGALLTGIVADPAAASMVAPGDHRVASRNVRWQTGTGRTMRGYLARPALARGPLPAVLVIHENRGLNEHIRDVARRVALAGYLAIAPDFLSPAGGTPADEDRARDLIARLDLAAASADALGTIDWIKAKRGSTGKVDVMGFCWGGAMADRIATDGGTRPSGVVAYYGPAPAPGEAAKVRAPLLLHYAGLDERVALTATPWVAALRAAGKDVRVYTYPGVNHAFNNDASAERYDAAAADLAWGRTLAFFRETLE